MLTPQQQVDARRYMGYPMTGDTSPDDRSDAAYAQATSGRFQTLAHRLTSLRAEEEAIVANYLTTLASLEWGITGGKDAETDDDFRARFRMWIASLSKATRAAIAFALSNVQNGMSFTLTENVARDGTPKPGYFYAIVDDGSGNPPAELIDRAYRAIDAVRGFTLTFGVFTPDKIIANVILSFISAEGADHAKVVELIEHAIKDYIQGLKPGQLLAYTQLVRVAYAASPLVTNVTSVSLNGAKADLAASPAQVIRKGDITVS